MKLLNLPGLFGVALGIAGLAFLADGVGGLRHGSNAAPALGSTVGGPLGAAGGLVKDLVSMAARADEAAPAPDFSDLLLIDEQRYHVDFGNMISTQVLSQLAVVKISFGHMSRVSLVKSPTGWYSTDGLISPHVQYPGVSVTHVPTVDYISLSWDPTAGWQPIPRSNPPSVITFVQTVN